MATATLTAEAVLGIPVHAGDVDDAGRAILDRVRTGRGGYACLCNVHLLVAAQHDPELATALGSAWASFADGGPVAWYQRRRGHAASRIAGTNLMLRTLDLGIGSGLRSFLFGSTPAVAATLERRIAELVPGARVVGAATPHVGERGELDARQLEIVRQARPDVVWCALGAPKQELWMHAAAPQLAPAVLVGVGAAFEFVAGTKTRAPEWMQARSLEWLHRLISEPRRLGARYARTNPEFVARATLELARRRRRT